MSIQQSLITGAASGIGRAFAEELARRGHRLILVDKSAEGLAKAADELRSAHGIEVETIVANLANSTDAEKVEQKISQTDLDVLINNAGFVTAGTLAETPLQGQLDMIAVHCAAPLRFCKTAIPQMVARRRGWIINVSSRDAFCRFPRTVNYAATKGYLWIMSETLQVELVNSGVKVQALCPGWVRTNLSASIPKSHFDPSKVPGFLWIQPRELVRRSLRAIERSKRVLFIPRLRDRLFIYAFGSRTGLAALAIYRRLRRLIAVR